MPSAVKPRRRQILVALGVVVNEAREILLAQRNDPKNPRNHLAWEFPGGSVEFGEHPADCAARETLEEVGIRVKINRLLNIYSFIHPVQRDIQMLLFVYLMKQKDIKERPHPACNEVKDVIWRTPARALHLRNLPNNNRIVRDIEKALYLQPL